MKDKKEDARKEITKPMKRAAAIHYENGDVSPRVIAKGKGYLAERLIEKSEELDLPIYKDEALAKQLTSLDIGMAIPEELYQVVAEIMIFVTDLDKLKDKVNYDG